MRQPVPAPPQTVPEANKATSGSNGDEDSLWAQYQAAIQNAVTDNWLRPDSPSRGCVVCCASCRFPVAT